MDEPKVNSDYLDIVSSALCFNEWWMVATWLVYNGRSPATNMAAHHPPFSALIPHVV